MVYVKTICIAVLWLMLNAVAQHYLYPIEGQHYLEWYVLSLVAITMLCVWIWRRWNAKST